MTWIVLGNYFLVNLVLAILLSNSTQNMDKKGKSKIIVKVTNYRKYVKKHSAFEIWRDKTRTYRQYYARTTVAARAVQRHVRSHLERKRNQRFREHLDGASLAPPSARSLVTSGSPAKRDDEFFKAVHGDPEVYESDAGSESPLDYMRSRSTRYVT